MTEARYRPARPEDIPEMIEVFLAALGDLYARNGMAAALPPRATMAGIYEHILATGIFRVAEIDGRIVAIAAAIVRDRLWFLASFWARPEVQRRGIGMPLLRSVWEAGRQAGATDSFTWASIDPTAMASYMKLGMVPGYQMLTFEGSAQGLAGVGQDYRVAALESPVAEALDQEIFGARRPMDHVFWAGAGGLRGRQVTRNGELLGYFYAGGGGVGPAAWKDPRETAPFLTLACHEAAAENPVIHLFIPGINHSSVRFALGSGFRLLRHAHFLTTAPFGRMDVYLPSGPSLF